MKRKFIIVSLLCFVMGAFAWAQPPGQGGQRPDRRVKVIIDNDLCGDADGLFALAHQVLCESVNIRGIVGAHLGGRGGFSNASNTAEASCEKANEILELAGLKGKIKVVPGSPVKMESPDKPMDSEGARLIIEEAKQCTPESPLYLLFGGPLTDAASALLLDPSISKNVVLLWIGGQEYSFGHQKPWGGISDVEYNLNLSIPAGRYIFNDSDVRLWQIPRDAYRSCLYGYTAMDLKLKGSSPLADYLCESVGRMRSFGAKEMYVLGDSPLVLLSSMQTFFEPDTASSDFVETEAPYLTEDGLYDFSHTGRKIRVYTRLDTGVLFKDMEDKLLLHACKK